MLERTLGGRIELVMRSQGLNNRNFAKSLGINEQCLSQYKYDARPMPTKTIIKLCTLYNVDANWLLLGKETKYGKEINKEANYGGAYKIS